jgi:hypothetical protein
LDWDKNVSNNAIVETLALLDTLIAEEVYNMFGHVLPVYKLKSMICYHNHNLVFLYQQEATDRVVTGSTIGSWQEVCRQGSYQPTLLLYEVVESSLVEQPTWENHCNCVHSGATTATAYEQCKCGIYRRPPKRAVQMPPPFTG